MNFLGGKAASSGSQIRISDPLVREPRLNLIWNSAAKGGTKRGRRQFGAGRSHSLRRSRSAPAPLAGGLRALGSRRGHPTCASMVHSPPLATADEIVLQHAELLQVLADVRKRNKGGRNDKHDTARVRFIKDFALRGLRFGKLVPTADLEMIRLEPKAQLSGPKLASMDAWAKRHAPDPRSANQGVAIDLTVEQLATLVFNKERG